MAKKPIKSPEGTASRTVARVRPVTKPGSRRTQANRNGDRFRRRVAADLAKTNARAVTDHEKRERFEAYHRIGKELNRRLPDKPGYGDNIIKELATAIGRQEGWLYKVRNFAYSFDQKSLDFLLKYADKVRWQHVVRLLAVESKDRRLALLNRAIKSNWSPKDLGRAIQKEYGRAPRKGGRPLNRPKNSAAGLRQLTESTKSWLRRYREVWNAGNDSPLGALAKKGRSKASKEMSLELEEAQRSLRDLAGATKKAVALLKPHCKAIKPSLAQKAKVRRSAT